jgi:hypothetical protein
MIHNAFTAFSLINFKISDIPYGIGILKKNISVRNILKNLVQISFEEYSRQSSSAMIDVDVKWKLILVSIQSIQKNALIVAVKMQGRTEKNSH